MIILNYTTSANLAVKGRNMDHKYIRMKVTLEINKKLQNIWSNNDSDME